MKQRIIAIVIAILLLCCIAPQIAFGQTVIESGYCGGEGDGKNLSWTLYSDGTLSITGTGAMQEIKHDNNPWDDYDLRKQITSLVIGEGVTTISDMAFYYFYSLNTVSLPDSVTIIGKEAFGSCDCLESITIPRGVSVIERKAFNFCTKLSTISVAEDNTTYCDIDGVLFNKDCTQLVAYPLAHGNSYRVPNFVTSIADYAFYLTSIDSITLPEGLLYIGEDAFYGCDNITNISIPNSVTTVGNSAFSDCDELVDVYIGSGVTDIGNGPFKNCDKLSQVTVSQDNQCYCDIDGTLYSKDCTQLIKCPTAKETGYTIPDGVTEIADYAFHHNENLTSISLPDSVTTIGSYAFGSCANLANIILGEGLKTIESNCFYKCEALTNIVLPFGVTKIEYAAFDDCTSLASITIPQTVTYIGTSAFRGCDALKEVYYLGPQIQWQAIDTGALNESLTKANIYFADSSSAADIIASGNCGLSGKEMTWSLDSEGTLNIYGSGSMENWKTATKVPWKDNRTQIENVVIADGVDRIGNYAFFGCTQLSSILIPDSVYAVGTSAFCWCESLEDISLPPKLKYISDATFLGCTNLKTISLGDEITSLGYSAFAKCKSLADFTIPSQASTISSGLFYDCAALSNVTFGEEVKTIGKGAFLNCELLANIYYLGSTEQYDQIYVYQSNDVLANASVNCISDLSDIPLVLPELDDISTQAEIIDSGACGQQLDWVFDTDGILTISGEGEMQNWDSENQTPWSHLRNVIEQVVVSNGASNIGENAFRDCTQLISVILPDSVKTIGRSAFRGCSTLPAIDIGNGVTLISYDSFVDCIALEELKLGNSLERIYEIAFYRCYSLKEVELPDSVVAVGDSAFGDCHNLISVKLSSNLFSTGRRMFAGCVSLETVIIPQGVKAIADETFDGCTALKEIYYGGTMDEWNKISKGNRSMSLNDVIIHYALS